MQHAVQFHLKYGIQLLGRVLPVSIFLGIFPFVSPFPSFFLLYLSIHPLSNIDLCHIMHVTENNYEQSSQ